jgi:WD40 repeat protein
LSPDGKTLASGSADGAVLLWNLTGKPKPIEWTHHSRGVAGLAFSPDGKLLATCSASNSASNKGGEIKVHEVPSGKERTEAAWARQGARTVAFSPDGKTLASGGFGPNNLKLFDVQSGKRSRIVRGANSVRAIAFSRDGKRLASSHGIGSARGNGSIQVWDTTTWQEVMGLSGHTSLCPEITFSTDGSTLASASNDGTVKLWDVTAAPPAPARMAARGQP